MTDIEDAVAPNSIFGLPDELQLKIFHELVAKSGSSAALLPSTAVCRALRAFLVGEPSLWTRVRVDTSMIDFSVNAFKAPRTGSGPVWPSLALILRYSADRPLSLFLNIGKKRKVTLIHIWALTELLRAPLTRCRSLVVHCFRWEHLHSIMAFLDMEELEMNLLEFCDIHHFSRAPHPRTQMQLLDYPLIDEVIPKSPFCRYDTRNPDRETRMFPVLKTLCISSLPHEWYRFYPQSLTSLSLRVLAKDDRPSWHELKNILLRSQHTLVDLELTAAAPLQAPSELERYTLPKLAILQIGFTDPKELIVLATSIDLPSLDTLLIEDIARHVAKTSPVTDPFFPDEEQFRVIRQSTLYGFDAIATNWPLHRVTTLLLSDVAMYEMRGNRVSQLKEYHHTKEDWEKNGIPFASKFFYEFKTLRRLYLHNPAETTYTAALWAPRYYDLASGLMKPVAPLFPYMKSYYINYD